jgi:hypothetical protein
LRTAILAACTLMLTMNTWSLALQDSTATRGTETPNREITFKEDVMPILKKECLPCHAEDNFNPSELSLDSRELLMAGGKHGRVVVPGNAEKSVLFQKLSANPPFGDRMPLDPKKKRGMQSTKSMSEEEIRIIRAWIEQGAK